MRKRTGDASVPHKDCVTCGKRNRVGEPRRVAERVKVGGRKTVGYELNAFSQGRETGETGF